MGTTAASSGTTSSARSGWTSTRPGRSWASTPPRSASTRSATRCWCAPGALLVLPGSCRTAGARGTPQQRAERSVERVLGAWEDAAADLVGELLGRAQQLGPQVGVLLDELRHPAAVEPGHVRPDQHLGVAVGSGADADRRDGQVLGHLSGDLG